MRLTCVLLTVLLLQIRTRTFSQTVTWSGKNVPVEKVFDVIKKQTGFFVFRNNNNLKGAHKISLKIRNAPLRDVLEKICEGQPFYYSIDNRNIVITRRATELTKVKEKDIENGDSMRIVKGIVRDEKGEPLQSATVAVSGVPIATASAVDGSFAIRVPRSKTDLTVTSIGFEELLVPITNLENLIIVLKEKGFVQGGEVVVIGYGTAKKADVTGSIAQVNIKDIRDRQNPDLPTLLQGKISGVDVNSGAIRVRGVTSFTNTDPLVVIDGFLGGGMETVNPNDIESIEVLKDASSSAIYGARGANGVILVTTRRPKPGATRISVNLNSGVGFTPKKLHVLNASQYIDYVHDALTNAGQTIPAKLSSEEVRKDATNWQDEVFKTSHSNAVDVNFSGGSDKSIYYFSLGYKRHDEIYIGPVQDDITARFKHEFAIRKWLKFGDNMALAYTMEKGTGPAFVTYTINMLPYLPVRDTANYWGYSSIDRQTDLGAAVNPVASSQLVHPEVHTLNYQANIWAEISPIRDLKYHMQYGVTGSYIRSMVWTDKYNNSAQQTIDNTFSDNSSYSLNPVWESYLTYTHKFSRHDLTVMLGNSRQNYSTAGSISIFGQNYSNIGVRSVFNAQIRTITGETMARYAFESYFGRINYEFNNRYLLTVNMRRDGSPRFAPQHRWAYFPSVAFAWKMEEENFVKSLGFFDRLKLRLSVGSAGNDAIGDFKYLSQIYTNGIYYALGTSSTPVPGATIVDDAIQDIRWESTTSKAIGVDMAILNNAASLTVEYFVKNSKDILFRVPRPESLGYGIGVTGGDAIVNAASCINSGIELQAGYRNSVGAFRYYIDANYTYVRNKVTSLGNGTPYMQDNSRTEKGFPIGYLYGYTADGVFKNQAELDAANQIARSAALKSNPRLSPADLSQVFYQLPSTNPGDVRFKDLNGDGMISESKDRSMLGNSIPTSLYGLTAQLSYKQFDLNVFLNGIAGSKVFYSAYEETRGMNDIRNQETYVLDRWLSEDKPGNGIVPRAILGDPSQNHRPSTLMVSSGNYLKLRQVSLGYSLPETTMGRMGLVKARFYMAGSNLFTIAKTDGFDPEFGGSNLRRGTDFLSFPLARTISIGLQLSL